MNLTGNMARGGDRFNNGEEMEHLDREHCLKSRTVIMVNVSTVNLNFQDKQ